MSTFQLYCGDAIDLMRSLPDASIDCIAEDIAYESLEKHRAVGTTTRLKQSDASSNEWFKIFPNLRIAELFAEQFRVLKKDSHLYFFCDDETKDIAKPLARAAGFTFWNELVWVKTKAAKKADDLEQGDVNIGLGYHYRKSKEYILFFSKGHGRKLNNLGTADVLCFPRVVKKYPTEKPYGLLCVLVEQSTVPGETVLDPFMGSGVAGAAAIKLGRNFIGGDIKESAVAGARERLEAADGKELPLSVTPAVSVRTEPAAEPVTEPKKRKARRPLPTEPIPTEVPGKTLAEIFGDAPTDLARDVDGQFMTGPLPGGPSRHLPAAQLVPPPRPEPGPTLVATPPGASLGGTPSVRFDGDGLAKLAGETTFEVHPRPAVVGSPGADGFVLVPKGHAYPGIGADNEFLFPSACLFDCGCWMGSSRSGGPDDAVDPFGECPKYDPAFTMPESHEARFELRKALAEARLDRPFSLATLKIFEAGASQIKMETLRFDAKGRTMVNASAADALRPDDRHGQVPVVADVPEYLEILEERYMRHVGPDLTVGGTTVPEPGSMPVTDVPDDELV